LYFNPSTKNPNDIEQELLRYLKYQDFIMGENL